MAEVFIIDNLTLMAEVERALADSLDANTAGQITAKVAGVALRTPTTVQLLQEAQRRIAHRRGSVSRHERAPREFSLAITAVEDAIMRFNRGMAGAGLLEVEVVPAVLARLMGERS